MIFVLELAVGVSRLRADSGVGGSTTTMLAIVLWINVLTGRSLSEVMYVEKTYPSEAVVRVGEAILVGIDLSCESKCLERNQSRPRKYTNM
jgi:hypothetical protein